jgi:hypothetical protein
MEPGSGSRVFIKTKADFEALIKNHEWPRISKSS